MDRRAGPQELILGSLSCKEAISLRPFKTGGFLQNKPLTAKNLLMAILGNIIKGVIQVKDDFRGERDRLEEQKRVFQNLLTRAANTVFGRKQEKGRAGKDGKGYES